MNETQRRNKIWAGPHDNAALKIHRIIDTRSNKRYCFIPISSANALFQRLYKNLSNKTNNENLEFHESYPMTSISLYIPAVTSYELILILVLKLKLTLELKLMQELMLKLLASTSIASSACIALAILPLFPAPFSALASSCALLKRE